MLRSSFNLNIKSLKILTKYISFRKHFNIYILSNNFEKLHLLEQNKTGNLQQININHFINGLDLFRKGNCFKYNLLDFVSVKI